MVLQEVKRRIEQLGLDADADCEAELEDLANILLKVVHDFEHKGRDYIFDRYWKDHPETEREKEARLDIAEFVLQALKTGADQQILSIMDVNDVHFAESIRVSGLMEIHPGLKRYLGHLFDDEDGLEGFINEALDELDMTNADLMGWCDPEPGHFGFGGDVIEALAEKHGITKETLYAHMMSDQ